MSQTDDDDTCLADTQKRTHPKSTNKARRFTEKEEDATVRDEADDPESVELRETLNELKSVITGLFKKVEQNEKRLMELQKTANCSRQ